MSQPRHIATAAAIALAAMSMASLHADSLRMPHAECMVSVPDDGIWRPSISVFGGTACTKVRADILLREINLDGTEGTVLFAAGRTIGPGERLETTCRAPSRNRVRAELTARDADNGKIICERSACTELDVYACDVPPSFRKFADGLGEISLYRYPGMRQMRATLVPAGGAPAPKSASIAIDGKLHELAWANARFTALFATPAGKGMHTVTLKTRNAAGECRTQDLWRYEESPPEWLGNSLGKAEIVIPPFTPISKAASCDLEVLHRRYTFNAQGLPAQVNALGRDIMASEAYYEIVVGSEKDGMRPFGERPRIDVRADGYAARITAEAHTADNISLASEGIFEYDGFLRNTVRLGGVSGRTVRRLTLVIPMKSRETPLMHACALGTIRNNPACALPPGDGLLWDSSRLMRGNGPDDEMAAPQCVPYVWVGAERRGLCWCVNNTCGFRLANDRPAVRIMRSGGEVRLEVDIVNRPVQLIDGHSFTFAMEATPVKSANPALLPHYQSSAGAVPEGYICRKGLGYITCGFFNEWAHAPHNGDWSAYAANCRRVAEGPAYGDFMRDMTNFWEAARPARSAYCATMPPVGRQTHEGWFESMWLNYLGYMARTPAGSYPMKYSDPTLGWKEDPAEIEFAAEWAAQKTGYRGAVRSFIAPSRMDYLLWCHWNETRNGQKGIYLDDMFPMACRNPDVAAMRDSEGRLHCNMGIFEMRELVRRVAVMQHQAGVRPRLLQVHMTNCLLVPAFAFATSAITWEDHYGEEVFQKRFPLDYVRAESLGTQIGCESVVLDGIYRGKCPLASWRSALFPFLTRTQLAIALPAGLKLSQRPQLPSAGFDAKLVHRTLAAIAKFGAFREDCRFVPFYDDDGAVADVPDGVIASTWRRPGRTLAVFGNMDGQKKRFSPVFNRSALMLAGDVELSDAESGRRLDGGEVRLEPWDFALVRIRSRKPDGRE